MFARISTVVSGMLCLVGATAFAQPQSVEPSTILFENVRIFDGKSDTLSGAMNLLVRGNTIAKISKDPIPTDLSANTKVIAGGGRTLMPGLIDMHWHAMLVRPTPADLLAGDIGHLNLTAGAEAADTLMRGFTTVRDLGGPSFGLKRAIDEGVVPGPRIYPSGAIITITGGHGDFRQPFEVPRILGAPQSRGEQTGAAMIADSPDEVRVRVREQLLLGATQIKLTAGGGVASPHSPLDVTRMIASVGFWIAGSSTVSTRTSSLPCQVTALIGGLLSNRRLRKSGLWAGFGSSPSSSPSPIRARPSCGASRP